MIVSCFTCEKEFDKPACWVARTVRNYCSKGCYDLEQRKASIRKNCKICGIEFLVAPSEARKFSTCSDPCYRAAKTRENNPNWRGGTSHDKRRMTAREYVEWRKAVYVRDDYTCQICGKRGGDLEADHIKPWAYYEDLRYEVSNGRTLCVTCHRTTFKSVFEHRKKEAV